MRKKIRKEEDGRIKVTLIKQTDHEENIWSYKIGWWIEINDILKGWNIIGFIKKQRLNCLGHVERMAEDNNVQKINLLAPEFGIKILAHPVCKMWIIQEPKKVALWNKRHFEEKKNGECAACLKSSVCIFVEIIYKMECLEGSGVPVLYIGRTVPKG